MLYLSNNFLKVNIEKPNNGYKGSRFNQMGKITQICDHHGNYFLTHERLIGIDASLVGKGLFDEFGIDMPLGYDECKVGGYFPKIGVGMLRKESNEPYNFFFPYHRIPFFIEVSQWSNESLVFECESDNEFYPFYFKKSITLEDESLVIKYFIENRGTRVIKTNQYVHNFVSINSAGVDHNMKLFFNKGVSFESALIGLNPKGVVEFDRDRSEYVTFNSRPVSDFYFDNLVTDSSLCDFWIIQNSKGVSISEEVDFPPSKVTLWGSTHVVSPEIFINIELEPKKSMSWSRKYRFCGGE